MAVGSSSVDFEFYVPSERCSAFMSFSGPLCLHYFMCLCVCVFVFVCVCMYVNLRMCMLRSVNMVSFTCLNMPIGLPL